MLGTLTSAAFGSGIFASGGAAVTFPLLTATVLLPLLGALAVAAVPKRRPEMLRLVALIFSGATLGFSLWMLSSFQIGADFQFETKHMLVSEFGISWHLGVDGISLFMVVLTGVLFPITFLAVTPKADPKPYYAWLLLLEAGCLGAFVALDLFLFFVFFEIVLVPMYFLIGRWGYADRVYAALKFFLYTMFGSALMLVGIVALAFIHHEDQEAAVAPAQAQLEQLTAAIENAEAQGQEIPAEATAQVEALEAEVADAGTLTFDLVEIADARAEALTQQKADIDAGVIAAPDDANSWNPMDWTAPKWIFLALALAFAVKVPLFPLHTWLPDAHTQAPTAGSVILAAVMLKLGTYGFIRFGLYLLPDAATFFAPVFVALGVIGIIYGAIAATMQKDLKRVVAYSSVAHLGFIALGTFALTTQSLQGSILQMVNHGVSTGALFLLVGMIYDRRHTRVIAELSGLQKAAPVLAGVFMVVMLSSIGLPGLNGFVGEFLILTGSYLTQQWWTVAAAGGVILAALYLLWAYQRVFHGEPTEDDLNISDLKATEFLVMVPLIGLIVFLGVYPKPFLDRVEPAVGALIDRIEATTDYVEPDIATDGFAGIVLDTGTGGHGGETNDHGEGQ